MTAIPKELISPGVQLGKYEIVHRLAYGGMAEIYLARVAGIQGFEKYVVLKRILPQYAANPEFVRMFLKEARLAATLDHANVAHVYDIGHEDDAYFFTMEYLHGEDLRWIMRSLIKRGERLPLEHALEIIIRAASGLHFAHERKNGLGQSLGIVHRDVSPSNIVVTYDGGVKVVDFGVAKMTADQELSRGRSLKGKVSYMSPEQINGDNVDRRGDVFALGIVLYEITSHHRLFRGMHEVETMRMVLDRPIPPPSERVSDYPVELERIVMRALAKDPAQRYQTARDLQRDLEAFGRAHDGLISSVSLGEWMERTFERKQEPWHQLRPPAAPAPLNQSGSRKTVQVIHAVLAESYATAASSEGDGSIDVELSVVARSPPISGRRGRLWVAAAAAVLALAGGAVTLRSPGANRTSIAPVAPAPEPVLLLAEKGNVAFEKAPDEAPPPPAAPPPTGRSAATTPVTRRARSTSATGAGHRAPDHNTFSATFARRQGDIRRCFTEAPDRAGDRGEISLRFQVGRNGRVASVAVLPDALAATPLAACLTEVASKTVFAPQAEAVTFRIPLTVQLHPGNAGPRRP